MSKYAAPALLVLLVGLVAFCAGRSLRAPADDVRWSDAVNQALGPMAAQYERTVRALSDSLAQSERRLASLSQRAAVARAEADSLRTRRQAIPLPELQPAACAPWAERLTLCEREVGIYRDSIVPAKDSTIALNRANARWLVAQRDLAHRRADSLAALLANRPGTRLRLRPFAGGSYGLSSGDVEPEAGVRLRRGEGQDVRVYGRLRDGTVEARVGVTVEF